MPDIISIDDPDDPRIAAYRDIRERDLTGRQGRFVAEGRVVLDVLLRSRRFAAESVLILENRVAGLADTLANVPDQIPIYIASASVLDRIVGFHLHRGILAIGISGPTDDAHALLAALPANALVVAPVGIANHDNIGAIFRNAAAFGADAVILDETCCHPLYRKSIRVSVGGVLTVPWTRGGTAEANIALLAGAGFDMLALSPSGTTRIEDVTPTPRTALLLGSEGHGLPAAIMARLTTVTIPMMDDFDSLNVATASGIALHRLWRDPGSSAA